MWSQEGSTGPKLPSPVPAQDAQPELQDGSPEEWHLRFRTFNGWENPDPIRDLRMLNKLCHRWLRPDLHTKEQIMDQLVLEQFLISTPPDVQVLVKESGVTSCRDLEQLLRHSLRRPTSYIERLMQRDPVLVSFQKTMVGRCVDATAEQLILSELQSSCSPHEKPTVTAESIIVLQEQKFFPWKSGTQMVGSESGVSDDVTGLSGQHPPSGAEIPPEQSQSPVQALQVPAGMQDPSGAVGEAPQPWNTAGERDPEDPSPRPQLKEEEEERSDRGRPQPLGAPADSGQDAGEEAIASGSGAEHPPIPASPRSGGRRRGSAKKRRGSPEGSWEHPQAAPRLYQCGDCSKSFCYRSQLVIHRRSHTGERPFQCEDCRKGFMQPSDFRVHQRVHTGEKPFVCADCGHAFSHEASLVTHRRVHTQERPYVCKYCGVCFSHKGNLNVHCRIHTNTKPYGCEVCGQRFRQLGTFKRHLKVHVGTVPPEQELWLRRMLAGSRGLAPAGGAWPAPRHEPPVAMRPAPAWPLLGLPGAAGHLPPGFPVAKAGRAPTPAERHAPE